MPATLRAIFIMILAMALLALSDLWIKLAARNMPLGQVSLVLSIVGLAVLAAIAWANRVSLWTAHVRNRWVLLRSGLELVGAISIVLALTFAPLAAFAAIMQAAPLVVTLGAAFLLGEHVGWRRWTAVYIGIFGMLLVVQPWSASFTPAMLFAVLGVVTLALRDLLTRFAPVGITSLQLAFYGYIATIPGGAILLVSMGEMPVLASVGWTPAVLAAVVTALGYFGVTTAMRLAPVAIVSPFRYTRLVFTMGLGILVLGERPDALTLLGAAIILATGLFTFWREAQIARAGNAP